MQQWEYKLEQAELGSYKGEDCTKPFLDRLNKLGKEGWEIVGVGIDQITSYTRPIVVVLKRPVKT